MYLHNSPKLGHYLYAVTIVRWSSDSLMTSLNRRIHDTLVLWLTLLLLCLTKHSFIYVACTVNRLNKNNTRRSITLRMSVQSPSRNYRRKTVTMEIRLRTSVALNVSRLAWETHSSSEMKKDYHHLTSDQSWNNRLATTSSCVTNYNFQLGAVT